MLKRKLAGVALAVAALMCVGLPADAATTAAADQTPSADSPNATAVNYLVRYVSYKGTHRVTTAKINFPGMWPERGGLWGLYAKSVTNTRPLYECRNNPSDFFVSLKADCEGKSRISTLGYIFKSKPTQVAVQLYRCLVPGKGHFVSGQKNCEGRTFEGSIGWALYPANYVTFSRFNNGPDHWETSYGVSSSYKREYTWYLPHVKLARTVPLYSCKSNGGGKYDHFLSRQSNCEGKTKVNVEGYLYTYKAGSTFSPLYRCILTNGDRYATTSSVCENAPGAKREGLLGYLRHKMW